MSKVLGTPPKIGMEIEANWPLFSSLSPAARSAFERAARKLYPTQRHLDSYSVSLYDTFKNISGPRKGHTRSSPNLAKFEEEAGDLNYPDGWDKGHDSGVEMRFDGPANNLKEAENLIHRGSKWLRDFGFHAFSCAGTHVHLGHVAWCDEMFGKNAYDPLRGRAETMMWAYFATREAAIFNLSAPHRLECGSCNPVFISHYSRNTGVNGIAPTTPLWAIHNTFITRPYPSNINAGFSSGGLQMRRKQLPTLEFRHFTGTHAETALLGYVRLLYAMFLNATKVVTEQNLKAASEDAADAPIIVNPYKYTVADLKKEIEDPWLLKWIDLTSKNRGEPITDEIIIDNRPLAVAAA